MSTFDEVIAAAQANIAALDQSRDHIESTKAKAEQARQQAAMLGAERLAHGTQGLIESCREAQNQIAVAKETLQALVAHTHQLKAYQPGDGGGSASGRATTAATQRSDGIPLPEPDGEKLLEDSQDRPGERKSSRFMRNLVRQTDDVESVVKQQTDQTTQLVQAFKQPTGQTQAGTVQPHGPVIDAAPPPSPGDVVTGVALSAVVAAQGIVNLAGRWKGRKT